jgi:hypothetical protein
MAIKRDWELKRNWNGDVDDDEWEDIDDDDPDDDQATAGAEYNKKIFKRRSNDEDQAERDWAGKLNVA